MEKMYFKRKAYDKLLNWKKEYSNNYAALLEGPRRVGKSTIAEQFAKNEFKTYILIDFSNISKELLDVFNDISNLNIFFLRLQAVTGIDLYLHESVIIFDEIQLFPLARQAIKHLVKDGRYCFIETGSLISIKKNVKNILIPSEEMKIQVYPMDYEEFLDATNSSYDVIDNVYKSNTAMGDAVNRKLMRDYRIYMAIGGYPQAVHAYINGSNFTQIDNIKREIIYLYEDDFKKIDPSGRISAIFHSIPAQLMKNTKKFYISNATKTRRRTKDEELLYDLLDSKTVLISYNCTDPKSNLSLTKDFSSYKLYLADTGLFVTLMYIDRPAIENEIYAKLLSDKLSANLGYLYENAVAQEIHSSGRELYYHTWREENKSHFYEIDFLISKGTKILPIEVKSSGLGFHESILKFNNKYSSEVLNSYLISKKDINYKDGIKYLPLYLVNSFLKHL